MPAEYSQHGIRFLYPENWVLTETDDADGNPGVSLESPDGGLMVLHFFRLLIAPAMLLDEMVKGIKAQYEDVEISPCQRSLGSLSASGREALFYCLDFLVQARMLVIDTQHHRVAAMYQAESRQFIQLEAVFEAILTGLAGGAAVRKDGSNQ